MPPTTIIEDPKSIAPPDLWPPDEGDGGGGGDGRGDGRDPSPRESGPALSASRLAVIFICSTVVMLFAAAISALIILRDQAGAWPPASYPDISGGLWLSTALIGFSSLMGLLAMLKAKPESRQAFQWLVALTFLFGIAFCFSQGRLWHELSASELTNISSSNVNALFFMITGLHVAHVAFGIAYLAACVFKSWRGQDFAAIRHYAGNCMIFWHFIGIVWLFLFGFLYP